MVHRILVSDFGDFGSDLPSDIREVDRQAQAGQPICHNIDRCVLHLERFQLFH